MVKKLLPLILLLLAPALLLADGLSAPSFSLAPTKKLARLDDSEMAALRASLQAKLIELHKAASFPGATIGFVLPDWRSGSVSVGLADVENKIALKPTDRMLAGSIGKTYVSAVMLHKIAVAVQFNTDDGRALKKGLRAYIADAMRIIVAEIEKKKAA